MQSFSFTVQPGYGAGVPELYKIRVGLRASSNGWPPRVDTDDFWTTCPTPTIQTHGGIPGSSSGHSALVAIVHVGASPSVNFTSFWSILGQPPLNQSLTITLGQGSTT